MRRQLLSTEMVGALGVAAVLTLAALTTGCEHGSPTFEYMPQMIYSPAYTAQEEGSMRTPVKGTIPRGFHPYPYAGMAEPTGGGLKNPLKPTRAVLQKGREYFNIYCIVCHGPYGEGNGYIVPKFPQPPTLQSDKVRGWPDGRIYHMIHEGGPNLMPSYASQIPEQHRWEIVHYIRVLQRAKHPSAEDLKRLEK
ncbi:MAG TPA: c-type cytochrome, partial [Bdellovibrionota bacterium]|nr:c-type cytochrome [Bdellovibrionota bacterium]